MINTPRELLQIRLAKIEDSNIIQEINFEELGYDYPKDKVELGLQNLLNRDDHAIYVACNGETVVGYIHAYTSECLYVRPMVEVIALAVKLDYQGQGVGRLLLNHLESWAREKKIHSIKLLSGETRSAAHEFYKKNGYKLLKEQMKFLKNIDT